MKYKASFTFEISERHSLELIQQDLLCELEEYFVNYYQIQNITDLKIEDVSEGESFNYEPNLISGV